MDTVKICEGISEISDSYHGFLIDEWGTIHDGHKVFPDVLECLEQLKKRGKQIILLSNSGKRVGPAKKRLQSMGLSKDYYDHVVTSAEATWWNLQHNLGTSFFSGIKDKCFLLNRLDDESILTDLSTIIPVQDINEADFILLTGSDAPEKTFENYYDDILRQSSRKRIKMICANPQKVVTIDGTNYIGSGDIANRYEEFGGVVLYVGKPYPLIFQYAMSLFEGLYPSQIAVIGDSLKHDIRGARHLDMDCGLIANGVHHGSFSKVKSTADIHKMLTTLGKNYGVLPTYFIPRFHWGKPLPDRKNKKKRPKE